MEINLKNKITFISGLNASGKTYFAEHAILPSYRCLVHDPLKQYPQTEADIYIPKNINYPAIALDNETFLEKYVKENASKYDLLIFEEASRTFPNSKPLMSSMRSFLDTYRHWGSGGFGIIFICRRPAQIFTDIPELSHHLICFGNKGMNDISRLNAESNGLGDLVATLSNYEYVFVDQDRTYRKMPKI